MSDQPDSPAQEFGNFIAAALAEQTEPTGSKSEPPAPPAPSGPKPDPSQGGHGRAPLGDPLQVFAGFLMEQIRDIPRRNQ